MKNSMTIDLNKTIKSITHIDILSSKYENEHFFSKEIGFAARDLVAILFTIEKQFNIFFQENEIQSEDFYYFNGLVHLLEKKISHI